MTEETKNSTEDSAIDDAILLLVKNGYIVTKHATQEQAATKMSRTIDSLELSDRTTIALKKSGIYTIGELLKNTEFELKIMPGIGRKAKTEIIDKLDQRNLQLAR